MASPEVETLIQQLSQKDWYARSQAAVALGQTGDEAAIPALCGLLKDKDDYVHYRAAEALGRIGAPTVPALQEALKDKDWCVRCGAVIALSLIGPATIPILCEALWDEDGDVLYRVSKALSLMGSPAVPALCEAIEKHSHRHWAAEALSNIRDISAVPALYEAFKNEDRVIRESAAEALSHLDATFVPTLCEALKDTDYDVRKRAAEALGRIGDVSSVPALCATLKDADWLVRNEAAEALGQIGDPSAVPALCEAFQEEDNYFRSQIAWALRGMGDSFNLPHRVLTTSSLTPQQRVLALESLRKVRFRWENGNRLHYRFPETRTLCQRLLGTLDSDTRQEVQAVLEWLETHQTLLRPSQYEATHETQELLRVAPFTPTEDATDTLLRASEPPRFEEPLTWQERLRQRLRRRTTN